MHELTDRLIRDVEHRRLGRREAVGRIVALAAAAFAGGVAGSAPAAAQSSSPSPSPSPSPSASPSPPPRPPSTFTSVGLNHIALRVSDVGRSRDFYREHLGLRVLQEWETNCFMAAGGNNFVAMFRSSKPGLDHFCFTIEDYEAGAVVERLRTAGLDSRRREDRVYFDDPDGIELQLASEWGDYPRSD